MEYGICSSVRIFSCSETSEQFQLVQGLAEPHILTCLTISEATGWMRPTFKAKVGQLCTHVVLDDPTSMAVSTDNTVLPLEIPGH
jgi:hypothetical protein